MKPALFPRLLKKFSSLVASAIVVGAASVAAHADCAPIQLPSSYVAEEQFLTIGSDFELRDRSQNLTGRIIQRTLNWTTTFDLQDARGNLIGQAQERFFTWGATVDVYDCEHRRVGTLKEEVLTSFLGLGFHTVYSILDASGRLIGASERVNGFSTDFTITSTSGQFVAGMHRSFLDSLVIHKWTVQRTEPAALHPLLYMSIPAFQSAAEHARARHD